MKEKMKEALEEQLGYAVMLELIEPGKLNVEPEGQAGIAQTIDSEPVRDASESQDVKLQFRSIAPGPAGAEQMQALLRDSTGFTQGLQQKIAAKGVEATLQPSLSTKIVRRKLEVPEMTSVSGSINLDGLSYSADSWEETKGKIKKALEDQLGSVGELEILEPVFDSDSDPTAADGSPWDPVLGSETKSPAMIRQRPFKVQFRSTAPASAATAMQNAMNDASAFSEALQSKMESAGLQASVQASVDSVKQIPGKVKPRIPAAAPVQSTTLQSAVTKISGKQMRAALHAMTLQAYGKHEQRRVAMKQKLLEAILAVRDSVRAQLEARIRAAFVHRMIESYGMEQLATTTFEAVLLRHFCLERYRFARSIVLNLQAAQRCAWASSRHRQSIMAAIELQRVCRTQRRRTAYLRFEEAASRLEASLRHTIARRQHTLKRYAST
eukprot:3827255-Rhodomonas_salina.1